MAGEKKAGRILLRLLGAVFSFLLLALLAAALILARPQEEPGQTVPASPSPDSQPPVTAEEESGLIPLIAGFPAPVMSFMSGSGMVFVSATSADAAVDGGFGRVATLYWQTPEGEPVTLQSIWPADAVSLLDGNYHFVLQDGPRLFGDFSVRMENDQTLRLHTATDQALYVVLLPRSLGDQVSALCRSIQLFSAAREE